MNVDVSCSDDTEYLNITSLFLKYTVSEKDCTLLFYFFFLGAQCVESGVSCTDCY